MAKHNYGIYEDINPYDIQEGQPKINIVCCEFWAGAPYSFKNDKTTASNGGHSWPTSFGPN